MAAMAWPYLLHFLVSISLMASRFFVVHGINEYHMTCGNQINLDGFGATDQHSGLLYVSLPKDFTEYLDMSNARDCDVTLIYKQGMQLLLELYYVDIEPISNEPGCAVGVEIFDGYSGKTDIYGRVCGRAWEWEKKHRESQQEKKISKSSPVTFRLSSNGASAKGSGFRVHFNEFRATAPCLTREFTCTELQRCIHDDLTCDGWDDCGDRTDEEEEAGCRMLTESEINAIIMGILFVIGNISILVVFIVTYRRHYKEYKLNSESKQPISNFDTRSLPESQITFPHRFNSMESMNKSAVSSRAGVIIKTFDPVLEKDRASYRGLDSVSERSYKKHRARSERDLSPDRDRRSRKSYYSDSDDDRDDRRRRRSKERSRDRSWDSEDESDYERMRRRRKRRSYTYSDEESDSDRDSRRRRRRRRSGSDDDSDSERERERRRRRRSKDRYRDKYDEKSDKEERSDRDKMTDKEKEANVDKPKEEEPVRQYDRNRRYQRRSRERDLNRLNAEDKEKPQTDQEKFSAPPPPYTAKDDFPSVDPMEPLKLEKDDIRERRNGPMRSSPQDRGRSQPDRDIDNTDNRSKVSSTPSAPREYDRDRRRRQSAERRAPPAHDEGENRYPPANHHREPSTERLDQNGPRQFGRSASRERLRPSAPAPPPTSEDIRLEGLEKRPEVGQLGKEAVREYRRRSGDDRRARRRSRGAAANSEDAPTYEDVLPPSEYVGYKEAAV